MAPLAAFSEITFDSLVTSGTFQSNHLVSPEVCAYGGLMYDPFGFQEELVRRFTFEHPRRIATLLKARGQLSLSSGFHFVGRVGYFIALEDLPPFEHVPITAPSVQEPVTADYASR